MGERKDSFCVVIQFSKSATQQRLVVYGGLSTCGLHLPDVFLLFILIQVCLREREQKNFRHVSTTS